jgi:hypothetical protein
MAAFDRLLQTPSFSVNGETVARPSMVKIVAKSILASGHLTFDLLMLNNDPLWWVLWKEIGLP